MTEDINQSTQVEYKESRRLYWREIEPIIASGSELGLSFVRNRLQIRFSADMNMVEVDQYIHQLLLWLINNTTGLYGIFDISNQSQIWYFEHYSEMFKFRSRFERLL